MIDAHVHIEKGPYTLEWIEKFIAQAEKTNITELYLLEHSHRFLEFRGIYDEVCRYSTYQKQWLERRNTVYLANYFELIEKVKEHEYPIKLKFGLEVCFLPGVKEVIEKNNLRSKVDFLTGSVHWINGWGFDHKVEFWNGKNVDQVYELYFEEEEQLIRSGLFDIVAHPDSIKCFGFYPQFDVTSTYERIAKAAYENDIKMEQSCGLHNNYGCNEIGLDTQYLKTLKKWKIKLITGSDAHMPDDVGRNIDIASKIIVNN